MRGEERRGKRRRREREGRERDKWKGRGLREGTCRDRTEEK